ncbi:response regulator transcription factor [Chloroflexota bacterium]
MADAVKLYVVEEQEIFREAYKAFFPSEPNIEVVGISNNKDISGIAGALPALSPDVMLLGTKMLDAALVDNLDEIRISSPGVDLVILSAFYDMKGIKRLREFVRKSPKGCAYLLKHSVDRISQLTQIVHAVVEGRIILDPMVMEGLIAAEEPKAAFLKELTSREMEVLNWMSKGFRNGTIAEVLCVDPKTVEHHINSIYSKLNVAAESKHPRVHAVTLYLRATGLMPGEDFMQE